MRRAALVSLMMLIVPIAAFAQAKIESISSVSDASVSDALKKALDAKGSRIAIGDGAYCDLWLRSAVPAGKSDAQGAIYNIGESALVGVISFAKATTDFRGQAVKAGTYTLRYAVHPADGNHLGISPIRDFLVMVPVAMDQNPETQPKFEELVKMSQKSTGTNHPGVISLVQTEGSPAPKIEQDGSHYIFTSRVKSQSGADVPIAFIVKGRAEQ